ncbi:MAG TPA: hypothetical protein VGJ81_02150 [Thermoanaerobaculia bacterium]|jgi:hypothetical protein
MKRLLLPLLLLIAVPLFASDVETTPAPPAPIATSSSGHTQLFQVVLVRGATSGAEELVGIPKNAEKAIRDIHDFLPFKSYKLLDSGLLRIDDSGKIRLDGVPPQQYDIDVAWRPVSANKLTIWNFQVVPVRIPGGVPLGKGIAPQADRPVIDTSFTIDVGETIVVGSSKLGGDVALVVLFTALPNR